MPPRKKSPPPKKPAAPKKKPAPARQPPAPPSLPFEAQWFFEKALPALRVAIFIVNDRGVIDFAGGAVAALLGRPATELVGGPFDDVLASGETFDVEDVEAQGRAGPELCTIVRRKNGDAFYGGIVSAALPRVGRARRRIILSLRDLTDELYTQEALSQRNEQLATLSRVSELVAEGGDSTVLMEKLLGIAMQALKLRAAFVGEIDRRTGVGRLAAHRGAAKEIAALIAALPYDAAWLQTCARDGRTPRLLDWTRRRLRHCSARVKHSAR